MLLLKARTGNEINHQSGASHSERIAVPLAPLIDGLHPSKPRASNDSSQNSGSYHHHRDTSKQMNLKPLELSSQSQQYFCRTTVDYGTSATMPYYTNDFYDRADANSMGLQNNIQDGFQMAVTKPK